MTNRKQEIYQEMNTSSTGYLQLWGLIFGEAQAIHDGLGAVPDVIYPGNPGKADVLPAEGLGLMGALGKISPYLSFLSPIAFWEESKRFYNEKNKSFEKTLDFSVTQIKRVVAVTATLLALTGVAYLAPYLIAGLLGLGVVYASFCIVKHLYRAYHAHKEGDTEKRNQHLWGVAKQALNLAVETLGFMLNLSFCFNIGSKLADALGLLQAGKLFKSLDMTKAAGAIFQATKPLLYGFGVLITLGLTKTAFNYNQETWQALKSPKQTLKNVVEKYKTTCRNLWQAFEKPMNLVKKTVYFPPLTLVLSAALFSVGCVVVALETASLVVSAVSRAFSLLVAPVQIAANKIKEKIMPVKKTQHKQQEHELARLSAEPLIQIAQVKQQEKDRQEKQAEREMTLQSEHQKMQKILKDKVASLEQDMQRKPNSLKLQSKLFFVKELQTKLGTTALADSLGVTGEDKIIPYDLNKTVDEVEQGALKISPYVYQSFWGGRQFKDEQGGIEKISRMMKSLDEKVRAERERNEEDCSHKRAARAA